MYVLALGFIFVVVLVFKSGRNVTNMLKKNTKFWDNHCIFPKPLDTELVAEVAPQNVPEGFGFTQMEVDPNDPSYDDKTAVQRLRYRVKLAEKEDLNALLEAAVIKSKAAGLEDDAFVLKAMKKSPGDIATKLKEVITNPEKFEKNDPISPAQALAMVLDVGLSEEDYNKLCKIINSENYRILPPLYTIRKDEIKAHPDGIQVFDDVEVRVGFL